MDSARVLLGNVVLHDRGNTRSVQTNSPMADRLREDSRPGYPRGQTRSKAKRLEQGPRNPGQVWKKKRRVVDGVPTH